MKDALMGGYIESGSPIHKMDAFIKFLSMLLLLVSVILSNTIFGYLITIIFIMLIIAASSIGFKNALGGITRMWLFFIIIFLMNTVFFETDTPLFSWWIFTPSFDGAIQGLNVVFRVALAIVIGNILISTTSPLEIIGAIETLIFPLKYIGVPVRDIAMIFGVAIQFIPTFANETQMIRKAQTARGSRFESKKLIEKAQSFIPLVVPIFLSAFRRADELSVAMEARGYRRTKGGGTLIKRKIVARDIFFVLFSATLCVAQIFI